MLPATSRLRLVLLAGWAVLAVACGGFVLALGTNCPSADEWSFVPVLTGHEPAGPWLWATHNEHRFPLPRLAYLTLFRLTHDFRTGMLVQVVLLAGLSLWLMRVAERLRGRPHWADLFFPLSLLHAAHWENWLISYQLCFSLYVVLVAAIGVVALRTTPATVFRSGVAGGVLAAVLALCGGNGVVVAIAVSGWLLYLAATLGRSGSAGRAAVLVGLALLPVVYLGLYLDGYQRPAHHPLPGDGIGTVAKVTGETLAVALGTGLAKSWLLVLGGMLLLGGIAAATLLRKLRTAANRPALVGVIAVAVGVLAVAAAVGVGRAGLGGNMGLASRYAFLTWPLLAFAFLFWAKQGGSVGKWMSVALCVAAAVAFPANTTEGLKHGSHLHGAEVAVTAEAATGAPAEQVAQRLRGTTQAYGEPWAVRTIPLLREAGIGAFAVPPVEGHAVGWTVALLLAGFAVWRVVRITRTARVPSRTECLLLTVWAVFTAGAVAFVLAFGSNTPSADEWDFVPALTGQESLLPWLWVQHNEHRLPLPRVIYLALFAASHDFRTGMLLQIAMLSAMSLGLMRLAARLRGRPSWADLFFPVSLLHVGHWENFLMGYQICFVLVTLLATAFGVLALRAVPRNAFASGIGAIGIAFLLALCGGSGLVVGVPVVGWVAFLAFGQWRSGSPKRAGVLLLGVLLFVLYLAVYFVGYHRPAHHPVPGDGGVAVALVTGETLSMALGIGVAGWWRWVLAGMLALAAGTLAVLVGRLRSPEERPQALGLIACAAGVFGLALAIGVGRAGLNDSAGLWSRYALLTWPLLGVAYLFWVKRGGSGGRWVSVVLAVASLLALPANTSNGIGVGDSLRAVVASFEQDVRAGVPAEQAARRLDHSYHEGRDSEVIRAVPLMRAARIGPFAADSWRLAVTAIGFVLAALAAGWLWHLGRAVQAERARELFRLQHERFAQLLLTAAGQGGKPRGLTWIGCEIIGEALLARDAAGEILALVPVVIWFEPVAGSDMEDVPAAKEPRPATAVFLFQRGHWHTEGRVVFNLDPHQAAAHFGQSLTVIESQS